MKLGAKELRVTKPSEEQLAHVQRNPLWIILDNVLDTYNIGSIYRLADAVGVSGVLLCGQSETPPSSRIHRAAVGTEEWVHWEYFPTAVAAIESLRARIPSIYIVAVEQDPKAVSLELLSYRVDENHPAAVVVGHETDGVTQEAMVHSDTVVEIPMWGVNKSLNVHVSASIAVYKLLLK